MAPQPRKKNHAARQHRQQPWKNDAPRTPIITEDEDKTLILPKTLMVQYMHTRAANLNEPEVVDYPSSALISVDQTQTTTQVTPAESKITNRIIDHAIKVEEENTKNPEPTKRASGIGQLPNTPRPAMLPAKVETPILHTVITSVLSLRQPKDHIDRLWKRLFKDRWLLAIILIACTASIISLIYFFQNHEILLTSDTYSHMLIARRLFDNLTPGVSQLGGVWLPLPHLLMLPFIWNDYLWHTGLAGSFVSMPCYLISTIYLFLSARRLTHNNGASFVGTLLFVLNPNVLYLQTTPLSELVLIATLLAASYYFLAWAQEDSLNYLIGAAGSTFLATLARYDAWALFVVFLVLIVVIGLLKHQRRVQIEANLLIFGTPGGLGIVLWLLWCAVIFNDPLYFQRSFFSSGVQQQGLLKANLLFTYHNLWQSLRTYSLNSIQHIGLGMFVLAVIAVGIFFLRRRITPEMVAASAFLVPFAFYVFSLYTGQAALFAPGASPALAHAPRSYSFYNARYGVETVAPAALFLATMVGRWSSTRTNMLLQIILSIVIIVQTVFVASGGIISLEEGQYGLDCAPLHPIAVFLAEHYNGGKILADTFSSGANSLGPEVGIDFKNMVYEGSGPLWIQALNNPASMVDWVIVNPQDASDLVTQHININGQLFQSQFTLEFQEQNGLSLFHRNGLPALPTHPISPTLLSEHRLCGADIPGNHSPVMAYADKQVYLLPGRQRRGDNYETP